MKHLKTYESWRENKIWFRLPILIIEALLNKIMDYMPKINLAYDELSAKIDLSKSLSPLTMKYDLEKISLKNIENNKIKNTIKLSSIFNKWNFYLHINNKNENIIYISKDELEKDDVYYSEMILKDSNFRYIVAAKHSIKHDKMKKERSNRYQKRKNKELEKLVDESIKKNKFGRTKQITGEWNNDPLLFKVVRSNRIDLFDKVINSMSEEEAKKWCKTKIDDDGWVAIYGNNDLLKNAKTPEMKKKILSVLYTPEELEQMEMEENAIKYNL